MHPVRLADQRALAQKDVFAQSLGHGGAEELRGGHAAVEVDVVHADEVSPHANIADAEALDACAGQG